MGYNGFCQHIFAHSSLKKGILQGAYDLLAADRKVSLDHGTTFLLNGAVGMFHALGVYTKDFAPKVIGDSEEHLLLWADQKSSSLDLPAYVDECHRMIESERNRCDVFGLDRTTRDVLEAHIEVSDSYNYHNRSSSYLPSKPAATGVPRYFLTPLNPAGCCYGYIRSVESSKTTHFSQIRYLWDKRPLLLTNTCYGKLTTGRVGYHGGTKARRIIRYQQHLLVIR